MPHGGGKLSCVMDIRSVIRVAYGPVMLTVRIDVYKTEVNRRPNKTGIERTIHEIRIPRVYETGVVRITPVRIVEHMQSAHLHNSSVAVAHRHIAYLTYPTVIIIIYGYVLNLDHRSVIVILHIRIVVVTRIETDVGIRCIDADRVVGRKIKIELPVRIDREGNSHLIKDESVSVTVNVARCVGIGLCIEKKDSDQYYC